LGQLPARAGSKYTFVLLQLGALQAGNIKRVTPILTLPVGSR